MTDQTSLSPACKDLPSTVGRIVRLRVVLIVVLICLRVSLAPSTAGADSADDWARMRVIQPQGYVCYRATQPVDIDGKPDDQAWQAAEWTDEFADIEGDSKPKPRFRTRAKMLWDDEFFYIAAQLDEPHVWGTLTEHDSVIFNDNDFEAFIDPNGDNHEYYEFEINAMNTGWDLLLPKPYKDGGKADNGWEIPGLKTAVHVDGTLNDPSDTDSGWSVEIAIPWKALSEFAQRPAPPRNGDQWRMNFSRVEWQHEILHGKYRKVPKTPENNWVWSPQGIIDMHRPERWGFVQFSDAKSGSVRFEPPTDWEARENLMTVYHHQKAFHQNHERWASDLSELGLSDLATLVSMQVTATGFLATAKPEPASSAPPMQVRQDSKLGPPDIADQIRKVITTQAECWNRGDISAFMEYYWKSDDLTFSSGGKVTRGWQTTLDNYQRRYPTRERMGQLTFSDIEVTPLGDSAALVLGRWNLQRETDPVGGNFTLIFRRIDGKWLIIHDHTSRREK